jgi:hypothetical protein
LPGTGKGGIFPRSPPENFGEKLVEIAQLMEENTSEWNEGELRKLRGDSG